MSLLPEDHKPGAHRAVQELGFSKVSFRDCTLHLLQVKEKKMCSGEYAQSFACCDLLKIDEEQN